MGGGIGKISAFSLFCGLLYNGVVKDLLSLKRPKIKWRVIGKINKFIDPVVDVTVGKKKLRMLLSQKTPYFYASFQAYDRALPRICKELHKNNQNLKIIDIGANIGDTASLIAEQVNGTYILCIEGDKTFIPFLRHNVSSIRNNTVIIEEKYCVDVLENNKFNIETKDGTAHLSVSDNNKIENIDTLDNMVNRNHIFKEVDLLKIDTDGFEITVLNGAKEILKEKHPIIFFEFTPEAYISNNQNPIDLIKMLNSFGYNKALFYDNFGVPVGIYNFEDIKAVENNIEKIDNNRIYYYDILCIHNMDEGKYMKIMEGEMKQKNGI